MSQGQNFLDDWRTGIICFGQAYDLQKQALLNLDFIFEDAVLLNGIFLQFFYFYNFWKHILILIDPLFHFLALLDLFFQFIVSVNYEGFTFLEIIFQLRVFFYQQIDLFFIHFEIIDERLSFHLKNLHQVAIICIHYHTFRWFCVNCTHLQLAVNRLVPLSWNRAQTRAVSSFMGKQTFVVKMPEGKLRILVL